MVVGMDSLQIQQILLFFQTTAISHQFPICAYNAVTGYYDRDRIAIIGHANRAVSPGPANLFGNLFIAAGLAVWNAEQGFPHRLLQRRSYQVSRQVKASALTLKILLDLISCLPYKRGFL